MGNGPKVLLAFHGIGQDHQCFMPLVEVLSKEYTLYLWDLPFHGQSPPLTKEKLPLSEWQHIVQTFLQQQHIERFSVMGFSMGGKFALATLGAFPNQVESCYLLAPDGITESIWYRLATKFWFSKVVFRFFVLNVPRFKRLADVFVKIGLVDKSTVRFAETTLATAQQRERVYKSWIGFSPITSDMPQVAQAILKYQIRLKIFLGQYDALLPLHAVNPLTKRLPNFQPVILKSGHHRLIEKVAEWLRLSRSQQPQ